MKNLKKLLLSGTVILLFSANLFAQGPDTLWTRTYGGNDIDWGHSIQQTSDGGYIVAGYTASFGVGAWDVYLIKTNAQGDTIWTKTYGGPYAEWGCSVQQTSDSGYIVAGWTKSYGAGSYDVYLIKTDANGDTLWTKTYGGTGDDRGRSVQQTLDGGYIIGGVWSDNTGGSIYLIKTDEDGDTLWTKTYGDTVECWSVQQTTDSGYIVAGYSYGVYLMKIDEDGDSLWTRNYGETVGARGYSVQQTFDGGYIIAGWIGFPNIDVYIIKTDVDGDSLWAKIYGGSNYDWAWEVQQTLDLGYIVVGLTQSFGSRGVNVYLIKTDSLGDTLWTRVLGGEGGDGGYSVQQTLDGGYIIAGFTDSFGAGMQDVYLIKTNPFSLLSPNGGDVLFWDSTYTVRWFWEKPPGSGAVYDIGLFLSIDGGNTYPYTIVTGIHPDSTSYEWTIPHVSSNTCKVKIEIDTSGITYKEDESDDVFTITQTVIKEQNEHISQNKDIYIIYHPNPFTSEVSVKCSGISEKQKVTLEIYDVSGRLVKSVPITTRHLSLGTDLKLGIYFLKLNGKYVGKVVKVR
ncbi:T9SS type A sorting domain-containing protein [candidate division WOR-3 bacterium]|nr:T9SS type A sorting domain-containing protein [candidate division WOR-3 bacterium]